MYDEYPLQQFESFNLAMYTYLVQCHPSNDSVTTQHPERHWWWKIANGSHQLHEEIHLARWLVGKGVDRVNDEPLDEDAEQCSDRTSIESDSDDSEGEWSPWQAGAIRLVRTGDEVSQEGQSQYNEEDIDYSQFEAGEDDTMWSKRELARCLSRQVQGFVTRLLHDPFSGILFSWTLRHLEYQAASLWEEDPVCRHNDWNSENTDCW